jgi:hypothetical protein
MYSCFCIVCETCTAGIGFWNRGRHDKSVICDDCISPNSTHQELKDLFESYEKLENVIENRKRIKDSDPCDICCLIGDASEQ